MRIEIWWNWGLVRLSFTYTSETSGWTIGAIIRLAYMIYWQSLEWRGAVTKVSCMQKACRAEILRVQNACVLRLGPGGATSQQYMRPAIHALVLWDLVLHPCKISSSPSPMQQSHQCNRTFSLVVVALTLYPFKLNTANQITGIAPIQCPGHVSVGMWHMHLS